SRELYGDYLANAQGEDVVAGVRDTEPISALKRHMPKVYGQFERYARQLEKHYKDVQDLEFTIERGKLYMLQTRSAKRTGEAAVTWGKQGKAVILVRVETNPNDVHGMVEAKGILTQTGGTASHAALVARGMGRPCVVGASSIDVDVRQRKFSANGTTIKEGDQI